MEELYDAYCIQRRLRDGASKMVAAFNSATGSREARESLSEANKGYRECTEVSVLCVSACTPAGALPSIRIKSTSSAFVVQSRRNDDYVHYRLICHLLSK